MALNLAFLKQPFLQQKKQVYPTKVTMNLAVAPRSNQNTTLTVALFVVAMIAVLLFAKFAVADVIGAAQASQAKAAQAQSQVRALEEANADYADVQQRYNAYTASSLSEDGELLVNRNSILNLLQNTVASTAEFQAVTLSDNVLQLQFTNATLGDVGNVVAALEGNSLVSGVTLSTAKTNRDDSVVATVTVTLSPESTTASGASGTASAAANSTTGNGSGA